MDYSFLLHSLEQLLGRGTKTSRENYAFHCPFCNHHKKKLEIDLATTEDGFNFFECWVCKTRGKTIKSLLYQLKVPKDKALEILKFLPKGSTDYYNNKQTQDKVVQLPEEFQLLSSASTTSIIANTVKKYLHGRGLHELDFIKYGIGYCTTGNYGGRIIIPSYSSTGNLNFFVARSYEPAFLKYKNPPVSKDIVFFENLINWDQPITLCEGVFDAFAIKRNVIPILGKTLSQSLLLRLLKAKTDEIYVALDPDAKDLALQISEKLLSIGKRVYLIDLPQKDPSDLGFEKYTHLVQTAEELDLSSLMMHKLNR